MDDNEYDVLNLDDVKCFLKEQVSRLELDKSTLLKVKELKPTESEGNYGQSFDTPIRSNVYENMSKTNNKNKSNVVKNTSGKSFLDSRELEKEKLINSLSVPKSRHSCPSFRGIFRPSADVSVTDSREKEKDRLAAIFAASKPCYLSNANASNSGYKNVKGRLCVSETQQFGFNKSSSDVMSGKAREYSEGAIKHKSGIPEIIVSEHKEGLSTSGDSNTGGSAMVRIGEFSPLNPNNLANRPSQGIGEYDEERRKMMVDRQKQEYNEYLQQAQKQFKNSTHSQESSPNNRIRTVATQTVWSDDFSYNSEYKEISPKFFKRSSLCSDRELQCGSPTFRASPVPKCFEDLGEKEVKELLYREELKRQIEEKNRLKEQMKKREEEEEARIEAKIQRDLEKMRRQYEEERLKRFELAIRRKEQEDFLREKLADEQLKVLENSKLKRKQCIQDKSISQNDKACQKSNRSRHIPQNVVLNQSLPLFGASNALTEVHEVFSKPRLEVPNHSLTRENVQSSPPERDVPLRKERILNESQNRRSKSISPSAPSPTMQRNAEIDILAQRIAVEPRLQTGISSQTENSFHPNSEEAAKKLKEVEQMLKAPLIPQTDRVLLPVSPPLLDVTIPPYVPTIQPPLSPPLPATKRAQRTNCELLEDKWKVPHTGSDNEKVPEDVFTSHNRSVLTQLGAFRRHLQQERLRMQQRVRDDSP